MPLGEGAIPEAYAFLTYLTVLYEISDCQPPARQMLSVSATRGVFPTSCQPTRAAHAHSNGLGSVKDLVLPQGEGDEWRGF